MYANIANHNTIIKTNKCCIIGIKGQKENPDYPVDIWFNSLRSVSSVLSNENQLLLRIISENTPKNLTELSALTGRAVSNLSRTLKCLKNNKLIDFERVGSVQKVKCLNKYDYYLVYVES